MIEADAEIDNADWTKQLPDIGVTTKAQLETWLRAHAMTLRQFRTLPTYRLAQPFWDRLLGK